VIKVREAEARIAAGGGINQEEVAGNSQMAHTVVWSPAAQGDMGEIGIYLEAKVSTNTAKNVIMAIRLAPYLVNDFPLAPHQMPEIKNENPSRDISDEMSCDVSNRGERPHHDPHRARGTPPRQRIRKF
jgi:plasmid stabilization system protein ParE